MEKEELIVIQESHIMAVYTKEGGLIRSCNKQEILSKGLNTIFQRHQGEKKLHH